MKQITRLLLLLIHLPLGHDRQRLVFQSDIDVILAESGKLRLDVNVIRIFADIDAKVDIKKVKRDEHGVVVLSPLRFSYDAGELRLPVRLGLLNAEASEGQSAG